MSWTRSWRAASSAALGAWLALAAPAAADPAGEARAVMERTVEDVLAILQNTKLPIQEKRDRIQDIAYERFDFETMSKLVLKRDWKKFDAAQQREFVVEFREHLSARYGESLGQYEGQTADVIGQRLESNGDVTVKTLIRGGQYDGTPVDYRLRNRSSWQVIDVVIENVSLVSSFRQQFADVLSKGGPEGVLKRLKERNAARAAAKKTG
jgi:phospholipid transport system substrate-binding protein